LSPGSEINRYKFFRNSNYRLNRTKFEYFSLLPRSIKSSVRTSFFVTLFLLSGLLNFVIANNPEFARLQVEQGLSQSSINCILQDSQGFMWFGSEYGINKYDGYGFRVFNHATQDTNSISDNFIRTVVEDDKGNLWIGTT